MRECSQVSGQDQDIFGRPYAVHSRSEEEKRKLREGHTICLATLAYRLLDSVGPWRGSMRYVSGLPLGEEEAVRKEKVFFSHSQPLLVKDSPRGACILPHFWVMLKRIPRFPLEPGEEDETCRCGLRGGTARSCPEPAWSCPPKQRLE